MIRGKHIGKQLRTYSALKKIIAELTYVRTYVFCFALKYVRTYIRTYVRKFFSRWILLRMYVRNLYVTGRSHLFGPARFWLDSRFVLLGWSCLVGTYVRRLVGRLVPLGCPVGSCLVVGWSRVCGILVPVVRPVGPSWLPGWPRYVDRSAPCWYVRT